jgi:EmrB/QacA subfamily drug resistance transporter
MGMKNSRWLSLLILCTGFLLIVVDMTIVNVALPSIGRDLRFSPSGLAWVINGYLVAFAGLLLLAGRLADLFGGKRVFIAGVGLFTLASLACGLSTNQAMLIAARFVQGVGGAASSAVVLAMIVGLFPEPEEQAKAFGIFSFIASAGAAIGLLAGGVITQTVSWHWIFFVNLPLGLAIAVTAYRLLPAGRGLGLGAGADLLGAALVTSALMLGVYAIVSSSATAGVVALALLAGFLVRQARAARPMLPLRLFRSQTLSGANGVQALMSAGFLGFFFMASLDLERVLGYGPLQLGIAFLPVAVVMGCFSIKFTAPLVMRFGAFRILVAGQALAAVALLLVGFGPDHASYARDLLLPMVLLGLGGGLTFPALTMIAMSDAPPADSGLASGLLNTTGQMGGALGLAVLATIAAVRYAALSGENVEQAVAMAGGYHLAWLVSAALVLISIGVAIATLRPRPQPVCVPSCAVQDAA